MPNYQIVMLTGMLILPLLGSCGEVSDDACLPRDTFQCWQGDVYWHDSCGNRGELKEHCPDEECVGNSCVVTLCTPHASYQCHQGDIYWFDSCQTPEDLKESCQGLGCQDQTCIPPECSPWAYYWCDQGDVYWFDECGVRGELKEDCRGYGCEYRRCTCESHSSFQCVQGDVYWHDSCGNREELKEDCQGGGCSGDSCDNTTCTSHDHFQCHQGDLYWYDSCGNLEDLREDCLGFGCSDGSCTGGCGNGVIEQDETCDPPVTCPENCSDGNSCTIDVMTGSAQSCDVACHYQEITQCGHGDDCCPAGCDNTLDDDCSVTCGNGVVEPGETCDPPASCPLACDDSDACTIDSMTGSAQNCNVSCGHQQIDRCTSGDSCCPASCSADLDSDCVCACGNGYIEMSCAETCDPPDSCPADCDDGDSCTKEQMFGSPASCNVTCSHQQITQCEHADGCCPAGCNSISDDDCDPVCGNGVVEASETCDPPSSCPTSCTDNNLCTIDSMSGSSWNCNVTCHHQQITQCIDDDDCCPLACNHTNDDDCHCFPDCEDRECGPDPVCGYSCGSCPGTQASCDQATGMCVCEPGLESRYRCLDSWNLLICRPNGDVEYVNCNDGGGSCYCISEQFLRCGHNTYQCPGIRTCQSSAGCPPHW